jgi:thiamine-phosphate pyrophosphorylase
VTGASHKPGSSPAALRLPPLYPIVDVDLCRLRGLDPVAFAASCVLGGARFVQVRQKGTSGGTGALLTVLRRVIGHARPAGARVIVNDRADLAAMSQADGVHVGQQDLPPSAARRIAGSHSIIGISTHTREQIDEAAAGTADYIAVGPVYRTATKETGYDPRGLALVEYAARTGRPVVAIGGITLENARDVLSAGARSVAVISDLFSDGGPERRVREFMEKWQDPLDV